MGAPAQTHCFKDPGVAGRVISAERTYSSQDGEFSSFLALLHEPHSDPDLRRAQYGHPDFSRGIRTTEPEMYSDLGRGPRPLLRRQILDNQHLGCKFRHMGLQVCLVPASHVTLANHCLSEP